MDCILDSQSSAGTEGSNDAVTSDPDAMEHDCDPAYQGEDEALQAVLAQGNALLQAVVMCMIRRLVY